MAADAREIGCHVCRAASRTGYVTGRRAASDRPPRGHVTGTPAAAIRPARAGVRRRRRRVGCRRTSAPTRSVGAARPASEVGRRLGSVGAGGDRRPLSRATGSAAVRGGAAVRPAGRGRRDGAAVRRLRRRRRRCRGSGDSVGSPVRCVLPDVAASAPTCSAGRADSRRRRPAPVRRRPASPAGSGRVAGTGGRPPAAARRRSAPPRSGGAGAGSSEPSPTALRWTRRSAPATRRAGRLDAASAATAAAGGGVSVDASRRRRPGRLGAVDRRPRVRAACGSSPIAAATGGRRLGRRPRSSVGLVGSTASAVSTASSAARRPPGRVGLVRRRRDRVRRSAPASAAPASAAAAAPAAPAAAGDAGSADLSCARRPTGSVWMISPRPLQCRRSR